MPAGVRGLAIAMLAAGCGPGVSLDPAGPGDGTPPAVGCGLARPAFCDGFARALPGGRGGDLDERLWGVARVTQNTNPPQGLLNGLAATTARGCGEDRSVHPGTDHFVCSAAATGPALWQALRGDAYFTFHALHPRRPFDFADRVGRIAVTVDAWTGPGAWLEIWMVDEPVPAARDTAPGVAVLPRNGVGLVLRADCPSPSGNGLGRVVLVADHVARGISTQFFDERPSCFATARGAVNRLEVHVGQGLVELRATDAGAVGEPRRVARISGLPLPLSRGYVHLLQVHDHPEKWGGSREDTRVWDDVGFDGPILPLPRAHEIADSNRWVVHSAIPAMTVMNTGHELRPSAQQRFVLEDVRVAGARAATLALTVQNLVEGGGLRQRWNGRAWREHPHPFPTSTASWRALALPVDPADLVDGTNVLELATAGSQTLVVANMDLLVGP